MERVNAVKEDGARSVGFSHVKKAERKKGVTQTGRRDAFFFFFFFFFPHLVACLLTCMKLLERTERAFLKYFLHFILLFLK